MKTATVKELKQELNTLSTNELVILCLRLSKFKKENKELLTYLLYEAENEDSYIENIKELIDEEFELINTKSYFYIKKSIRKILRTTKKYIRYSLQKETEIELLLYFCEKMKDLTPSIHRNKVLENTYLRQLAFIQRRIPALHEDLQYDYLEELKKHTT